MMNYSIEETKDGFVVNGTEGCSTLTTNPFKTADEAARWIDAKLSAPEKVPSLGGGKSFQKKKGV